MNLIRKALQNSICQILVCISDASYFLQVHLWFLLPRRFKIYSRKSLTQIMKYMGGLQVNCKQQV